MKSIILFLIMALVFGCSSITKEQYRVEDLNYPDSLKVIEREDWGWKPLEKALPEHKISKITIHHGGVEFNKDQDPVEEIRNLQNWSRAEKKWIDIPYHFMIDLNGNIYEARPLNYPGATNTAYDPTGHALVEVMGNYEVQTLSKKQLNSIIDLTAFLAGKYDVPVSEIKAHKDYAETLCPGKDLYKYLENGAIQSAVGRKLEK